MSTLRWVCSKVHLYVGLVLSLVLIVISLTGSALVFRGEIDRLLWPDLLRVDDPAGTRIGPGAAVETVSAALPDAQPRLLHLPQRRAAPYKVWLKSGDHAFVDAYRPALLGTRGSQEGVMNTLFALHAELLAGATGLPPHQPRVRSKASVRPHVEVEERPEREGALSPPERCAQAVVAQAEPVAPRHRLRVQMPDVPADPLSVLHAECAS